LYRALGRAKEAWENGVRNSEKLRELMLEVLTAETEGKTDYISVANPETLEEYTGEIWKGNGALLSIAVRFGTTRLIDNILCP
jgi:pantothenate synthetase